MDDNTAILLIVLAIGLWWLIQHYLNNRHAEKMASYQASQQECDCLGGCDVDSTGDAGDVVENHQPQKRIKCYSYQFAANEPFSIQGYYGTDGDFHLVEFHSPSLDNFGKEVKE